MLHSDLTDTRATRLPCWRPWVRTSRRSSWFPTSPIGSPRAYQGLQVIEKVSDSEAVVRHLLPVAFVPLIHDEAESNVKGAQP
jgi:hypothetical protein